MCLPLKQRASCLLSGMIKIASYSGAKNRHAYCPLLRFELLLLGVSLCNATHGMHLFDITLRNGVLGT